MLQTTEVNPIKFFRKTRAKEMAPIPSEASPERREAEKWLAGRLNVGEPTPEIITLTPLLAGLLLERNKDNRGISAINLGRIKNDLVAGRFQFNGEAIVVAASGELNDGQHRCRAVFETGVPIKTVVVWGAPRESRMTLDQGNVRSAGHYLSMAGFTDVNRIAAIASHVLTYRKYGRLSKDSWELPNKSEILGALQSEREIIESSKKVNNGFKGFPMISIIGFAHWAFSQKDPQGADEFLDGLKTGAALARQSPILYCRNKLMEMKREHGAAPKAELLFRCWNLWRKRKDVPRGVALQGGALPELED